jgi:hypothetical protein
MLVNPVEETLQWLRDRELNFKEGKKNGTGLVSLKDAEQAIQDLENKLWAVCQEEMNKIAAGQTPNLPIIM